MSAPSRPSRSIPVVEAREEDGERTPEEEPRESEEEAESTYEQAPDRSIRNISIQRERPRPRAAEGLPPQRPPRRVGKGGGGRRIWLWVIAVIAVVLLAGILFVAFRGTRVSVIPRSHTIVFDQTVNFTAYPAATAASGTLAYTVKTADFEDSEPVASSGTVHADEKASGTVTVFNNYSTSPVKLIATTRFQSPDGKIFRTPNAVTIPGKTAAGPGQVSITVVADQSGDEYNVAPGRFTVPGLQGTKEYDGVYAVSNAAMTGGFSGDRPNVDPSTLSAAEALVRGRLADKAHEAALAASSSDTFVLPDLAVVTYADLPPTSDADGTHIHEKAHVEIPVFAADAFAHAIAESVSADAAGASVRLVAGDNFAAQTGTSTSLGADPVIFTLTGSAELVWNIDASALATALAGKDRTAFQTIATGFSGVQSATARIEPFWSNTFPTNPKAINIVVAPPKAQ